MEPILLLAYAQMAKHDEAIRARTFRKVKEAMPVTTHNPILRQGGTGPYYDSFFTPEGGLANA